MLQQTDQNLARTKTKTSGLDSVLGLARVKVAKSAYEMGVKNITGIIQPDVSKENRIPREQEEERIVQGCLGIDVAGLHVSLLLFRQSNSRRF